MIAYTEPVTSSFASPGLQDRCDRKHRQHAPLRLIAVSVAMAMIADLAVAATLVDLEACEAEQVGWLTQAIVRDVDKPSRKLILDFGPTTVGVGVQQDAAIRIEQAIGNALDFYRNGLQGRGAAAGTSALNPWDQGVPPPKKMLCITDPTDNAQKYVIFPDSISADTLGEYRAPRPVLGGVPDIRIDPAVVLAYQALARGGRPDSDEIVTPAHELFHAIEAAHKMFTHPMLGGCKEYNVCTAHWVGEGIADAMAYAWLRNNEARVIGASSSINIDRMLPHLDLPLHKTPDNSDEAYAASLFWEYLAWEPRYVRNERDHAMASGTLMGLRPGGNKTVFDPRLILRFMNMDPASIARYSQGGNRRGAWELEWLDKVLRDALVEARSKLSIPIPRNPKGGLWVVYPKYAAWLVAHQTNMRSPQIMPRLKELFPSGCLPVTLTMDFEAELTVEVPDIASVCIVLERQKVSELVDITLRAPRPVRDRIHLGWNGEVIPPHRKGNRTAKRWTVGMPMGAGSPSPTGLSLVLVISNVPEDTSTISAQTLSSPAAVARIPLTFRVR